MKTREFKPGDRVLCNGYPCIVKEVCSWDPTACVVRLERGEVHVDMNDKKTIQHVHIKPYGYKGYYWDY